MSAYHTAAENATETAVESTENNPDVTGPHSACDPHGIEPDHYTYWRCSECGYESVREQDLYRASFHADDCAGSEVGRR